MPEHRFKAACAAPGFAELLSENSSPPVLSKGQPLHGIQIPGVVLREMFTVIQSHHGADS